MIVNLYLNDNNDQIQWPQFITVCVSLLKFQENLYKSQNLYFMNEIFSSLENLK